MRAPRLSALLLGALAATIWLALPAAAQQTRPNLLLIILDDVSVETLNAYNQSGQEAALTSPTAPEHRVTPNLDGLAQRGFLFRNAWSAPACRATRRTILSGQYGFRSVPFPPDTQTVADLLPAAYVDREMIGKWHVTDYLDSSDPDPVGPTDYGFTRYQGDWGPFFVGRNFSWATQLQSNPPVIETDDSSYLTTREIETAIAFVQQLRPPEEPWFLWLALHALHNSWKECETPTPPLAEGEPLGPPCTDPLLAGVCPGVVVPACVPPRSVCDEIFHDESSGDSSPGGAPPRRARCKMLEIMDHEIGRLLDAIDALPGELQNTTVIVVGDNGTPVNGLDQIPGKVNGGTKGRVHEGGVNVPLIVAGAGVASDSDDPPDYDEKSALVHTVDIFSTLLDLAGAPPPAHSVDGVSFAPLLNSTAQDLRSCVYSEGFVNSESPGGREIAVRDPTYKLIQKTNDSGVHEYEFYDLLANPGEDPLQALPNSGAEFEARKSTFDRLAEDPGWSPCKPSCVTAVHSCTGTGHVTPSSGAEVEIVLDASNEKVDADCKVFTDGDGTAGADSAVTYSADVVAGVPDTTCWFAGDSRGPFPMFGAGLGPVYQCSTTNGHCAGEDCCDEDSRCPAIPGHNANDCDDAIPGYDGYHATAAMAFVSGLAGTTSGTQNHIDQARFRESGDGISVSDDTGDRSVNPVIRVRHSCFQDLHDNAIEEGWRKHDVNVQYSLFNRVNHAFAYRARDSIGTTDEVSGWRFTINNNFIRLHKFPRSYGLGPSFGGLFDEDPSTDLDRHPEIVFTNNLIYFTRVGQYSLSDAPDIFPYPPTVTSCSNNTYLFGGTGAQWANLMADDTNRLGDRLQLLNETFDDPNTEAMDDCIRVLTNDSETSPEGVWYNHMTLWEFAADVDCGNPG